MKATITRTAPKTNNLKFSDLIVGNLYNYRTADGEAGVILSARNMSAAEVRMVVELKGSDAGRIWLGRDDDADNQFRDIVFTPFNDKLTLVNE